MLLQFSRRSFLRASALAAGGVLVLEHLSGGSPAAAGSGTQVDPALPGLEPGGTLETLLDERSAADTFSGVVLIARDGVPVFAQARGLADRNLGTPNTLDTAFNIGSMTKMFTATAIARLVGEGRVAFSDTIDRYLPEFPAEIGAQITIHHLLTHTSGLGDIFTRPRSRELGEVARTSLDLLPLITDQPLQFPPGEGWAYSNAGFVTLGAVIERVTGVSYDEHYRATLYPPAGMTHSDAYDRDALPEFAARGYTRQAGMPGGPPPQQAAAPPDEAGPPRRIQIGPGGPPEARTGPPRDNSSLLHRWPSAAGGTYATAWDMVAFGEALLGHRLLDEAQTIQLITGKVETAEPDGTPLPDRWYAYGFADNQVLGHRVVGHTGGAPGVSAAFEMYLGTGYSAAVLTNLDQAAQPVIEAVRRTLLS